MHGKNTPNFRASLHLTGGSATAAAQITMFANDLKKRWRLNSGHALTAGFQIWHLCSKNHNVAPEQAFHIAITAGNLVKKQILQPPKNPEELKSNLDAAAEIIQASISLKKITIVPILLLILASGTWQERNWLPHSPLK